MTWLDEILMKFLKSTNKAGMKWLNGLFNANFKTTKMPDEWMWSTMFPLYKHTSDIQNCNNYRDIKFLSYTMKVWEKVVEIRVRKEVSISKNQYGSCRSDWLLNHPPSAETGGEVQGTKEGLIKDKFLSFSICLGDGWRSIQEVVSWCMLFVDDILLTN